MKLSDLDAMRPPYQNPYAVPFNLETLEAMTIIARGQAPGQPNHTAYRYRMKLREALEARPRTTPHKRLMRQITKALKKRWPQMKVEVRNVGVGGYKDKRTGAWTFLRFGQVGEADLRLTLNGRAIALEAKALETGDVQRESQVKWQAKFEAAGGFYAVVHSVDEAVAAVEKGIA